MGHANRAVATREWLPGAAVAVGAALLAGGFLWPALVSPRRNYNETQAKEYLEAASALHSAVNSRRGSPEDRAAVTQEAKARFDGLRGEVERVRNGPKETGFWLKAAGSALICVGSGVVLSRRYS
ncbi:MAG: hypothetical protein AAGA92_06235 [Planctomycetota bacterium]